MDDDERDPDQALTRPDGWQVTSIDSDDTVETLDPGSAQAPTLVLDPDGTITGSTGVNRFRGTYELAESLLEIGPLATTRMAGPPEAMDLESRFLAVLAEPLAVRWDYETLVLESDSGQLRLEAGSGDLVAAGSLDAEPDLPDAPAPASGPDDDLDDLDEIPDDLSVELPDELAEDEEDEEDTLG